MNLTVNARDAMPDGGTLTIEARNTVVNDPALLVAGPCVHLAIRDAGVGMTHEVRARLFEPFFTTKAPGKGTGLGLATTYGIVRQAKGDIAVESRPGAGSTFHVYLPRSSRPLTRATKPTAVGGPETILLVEDDALVRSVTRKVLTGAGYQVLEASSGHDALELARSAKAFDAVISDVMMPGLNGPQMARQLRGLRPSAPVLFVTGHASDELGLEKLGQVLHKPFTPPALLSVLRAVLDARARAV